VGITRTWIFPILRIIIFVAIAAALVKLAFFADPAATSAPEFPTGEITEPQVPVAVGTITNDVTVTGSVAADAAVPVKATLAGEVSKLLVATGQAVAADTPVLTLRSETPGVFREDGTQAPPKVKTVTVLAGSAGLISAVPVIVGQTMAVGEVVAQVAPTTFNVSGPLAPEQQYRLLTRPADALVTITGGPAPFTCGGLTITTALAGAGSTPGVDDGSGTPPTTGATVRCAVPPEVTVFAGLAAQMTLAGGIAENVLTVPTTAVEGASGSGNVYVVLEDGSSEPKPVTLGLNDGTNVEIKDGVAEGEMVLQFVPGAPQPGIDVGGGCIQYPDGSTVCEG
jgi:multidrug efflux pump subunit AcrA (membrane-fusion protein)